MGAMKIRVTATINVHKEGWDGIHIVLDAMQKPSPYQWGEEPRVLPWITTTITVGEACLRDAATRRQGKCAQLKITICRLM